MSQHKQPAKPSEDSDNDKRFRRHANDHFASHACLLPVDFSPRPTSASLARRGFERITKGYYRKDFSGVLELRFRLSSTQGTFYDWIMNKEMFAKMVDELETLQMRIARETRRLRKLMKAEARQVLREGAPPGTFLKKLMAAAQPVRREVADFRVRYEDFLETVDDIHAQGPYYRTRCFCFDACTTTHELGLLTEFITLYMQVFGDLRVSRSGKALSAEEVREAITAYHVYYAAIKRIRTLWSKGASFEDIQKRFSTISEQSLEDITLECGGRGWDYRASDWALDLASSHSDTTVGHLRQMLNADKALSKRVRQQIAAIKDIEEVLNHRARVPALWPFGAKREQEERAYQIIRSVLKEPLPDLD